MEIWTKITLREATEEEKREYGYATEFYDCKLPNLEEEVLLTNGIDVWTDRWDIPDNEEAGFDDTVDIEGLYWISFPELPTKSPNSWNKLEVRECEEEEIVVIGDTRFDSTYDGKIPELYEKVFVSDGQNVWIDVWDEFDYSSVGFRDTDLEVGEMLYWQSFPKLPKKGDKEL